MSRIAMLKRLCCLSVVAAAFTVLNAADARAQGFFSPFIGYDYGGASACPTLRGCDEKKLNFGVSFGKLGGAAGFEQEFAYAKNFFGTAGSNSSVLTLMSNVMIAPKIGPVRPYGLFGVGLMKSHVDLTPLTIVSFSNNSFAWDFGGGLMVFFGQSFGIRGEVRHYSSFQDVEFLNVSLGNTKLNYNRASAGLVLMF